MQKLSFGMYVLVAPFALIVVLLILSVARQVAPTQIAGAPGGDPARGQQVIQTYGCGACHVIGGISGANGKVGPNLAGLGERSYIAGQLPNTVANMVLWIMHPQQVEPGVDMPDLGITEQQAQDIAAYLYTLK